MSSIRAKSTSSPRSPLKSISNKKRSRSPPANDTKPNPTAPPNKKQKLSSTNPKSTKKPKKPQNPEESLFLSNYTSKTTTITRIFDNKNFDDDADEKDNTNNKSRQLKFNVLFHNLNKINEWVRLNDIFKNVFKYSSKSNPTLKQMTTKFINAINLFLNENCIPFTLEIFIRKLNKKYYISEKGFCILLFILSDFDSENVNIKHFRLFRFYYRNKIFNRKISGINIKKSHDFEIEICNKCCLEDIENNFEYNNPCDCQCILHLQCNEINKFTIPNLNSNKNEINEWFCPFCIQSGIEMNELIKRRTNFNEIGEFEVEEVIFYDIINDVYVVKWKNYPIQACEKIEISLSFIQLINEFWNDKKIPLKAQNGINAITNDENSNENNDIEMKAENNAKNNGNSNEKNDENNDIEMKSKNENINENSNENINEKNDENDIEMKSENNGNINGNNGKFIGVKLYDTMDKDCIIRRQKYTKETYSRMKLLQDKYRKWLQKEVKNQTSIGMDIIYEMRRNNTNILPKYHLRSINKDWDCTLPRIHDIIIQFLQRDWNKWEHDISHKSFVIGDIIDMENPAKKYGYENSKAYGLFAVEKIKKDTLLFEYSGVVKRIGDTSKYLNHLETELEQTTLFDLIGHLDNNRNKLFWGKKPNDQLVIDPSKWHNEGIYMNDYRDRVMDDPDDDICITNDENGNEINKKVIINNNKMRKQNVKFYEVLVNNWPRVFAVAIEDINIGQELLGDYGCDFWSNFRIMIKRQKQLAEIKKKINDEWKEKYGKLENKCEMQEKEIEKLKKEMMNEE